MDNAGRVPGVLLAAAHVGSSLLTTGESFLEQIATAFQREVERRTTAEQRSALAALSLMTHVGISGNAESEASVLSRCFGVGLNAVLTSVQPLAAAGFLRVDGSYAEVVPPPLANRLSRQP
ncbi:MAG: hypothetical protein JWL62_41 [Hyphomicrobiales bacterium]|nr:hypothetical protein [Hyphomicrobiales bacterium]